VTSRGDRCRLSAACRSVVCPARGPRSARAQRQGLGLSLAPGRRRLQALTLDHRFSRPYPPRTSGKAERFIQTLLREWAYVIAYPSSAHRTAALARWLHYYN